MPPTGSRPFEGGGEDIQRGGDPAKFVKAGYPLLKGWSYRDMWWVSHNPHGAYMARGIHGQSIYVDPKAEMVIVRYAAHPVAANGAERSADAARVPGDGRGADAPLSLRPACPLAGNDQSPSMIRLSTSSKCPFMTGAIFQPAPPVM